MLGSLNDLLKQERTGMLRFGGARMALLDIEAGFWGIRRQVEALIGSQLTNSVLQQAGVNGGASFAESFGKPKDAFEQGKLFESCVQAYQLAGFGKFEIVKASWPIGRVTIQTQDAFEAWVMIKNGQQVESPVCAYTAGVLVGFINVFSERKDVVCIEHKCQAVGDEYCEFELLPGADAGDRSVVAFTSEPGLGRQLNLLEMLFERMPMGIAILDRNYCVQRFNSTWVDFSERYAPPSGKLLESGIYYFDHLPGTESVVLPLFERVLAGETIRQDGVRLESEGIVTYWDIVLSPLFEDDSVAGILSVSVDSTERITLQQNLELRVEERTRELSTLLKITQNVSSMLDLDELLGTVLEQLKSVVEYSGASLMTLEDKTLRILSYRGPIGNDKIGELRIPLDATTVNFEVIRSGEPVIISDVYEETASAGAFRKTAGENLDSIFGYIRCWMGIPLAVKGQVIGMLSLDHHQPNFYTPANASLALAFAHQAAVAIENARLFQEVESRRKVAESFRDIIGMINSNLPLEIFLKRAVKMATQQLGATACSLHRFEIENQTVIQMASYGLDGVFKKGHKRSFSELDASGGATYLKATLKRQPTHTNYPPLPERIDEIKRATSIPDYIKDERITLRQKYAGSFSVPLFIQDKVYGGMVFYYTRPQDFTDEKIQLGLTFSEQVAVAIENANLHQQEQERQRELQVLLDVAEVANSSLDLDETLIATLDLLINLVGASRAGIVLVDTITGKLGKYVLCPEWKISPDDLTRMLQACETVVASAKLLYLEPNEEMNLLEPGALLPLQSHDQILGVLVIISTAESIFNQGQLNLYKSIADQLSIAIENARLYEQAELIAVAQERNRLARDLHDAVSQTLFSASLIAEVLPKLWERSPEVGKQKLDELRLLTRGALSEMRTLLLELRPASLIDMDLADLLRHLTNAFTGRTRIPVELVVEGLIDPSPNIKEVFYRVAQETLNNVAKHAEASQVSAHLERGEEQMQLEINDDGRGFAPEAITSEHLGLGIMRERAEAINAELSILSEPGKGTQLKLFWRKDQE